MIDLANFVDVSIELSNPSVDVPAFDAIVIYDHTLRFSETTNRTKEYSKASDLLDDPTLTAGNERLTTASHAYKAAEMALSGSVKKIILGVSDGTTRGTSQRVNIAVGETLQAQYNLRLQRAGDADVTEVTWSTGSETAAVAIEQVYIGLLRAISKSDRLKRCIPRLVRTGEPAAITGIELDCYGVNFVFDSPLQQDPNLTVTESQARTTGATIASDLNLIMQQKRFYFLIGVNQTNSEILQRSAWCEANKKLHLCSSSEMGIVDNARGFGLDLGNMLFNLGYERTAILYSANAAEFPEAKWASVKASAPPGSVSWAYAELKGINIDNLTDNQFQNASQKNVNVYIFAGDARPIVFDGKVTANEYIDTIIGIDWLRVKIQTNVFSTLAARSEKLPFNNDGIAIIGQSVSSALEEGLKDVLESYNLDLPTLSSFSPAERKGRHLNKIQWTGTLQSAVHTSQIRGTVSY